MENNTGESGTQNGQTGGENTQNNQNQGGNNGSAGATKVEVDATELADLKKKAEVSSQNFERAKKAEDKAKELETKLNSNGSSSGQADPAGQMKVIEEKVDLRLAGHSPEEITEIEAYAKGRGISLTEAAKSPFITKAVEAIRAEKKSTDNTPAPSSKIKVFKGKPVDEIFKSGTPAEKQEAFEARMNRGGAKGNE